MWKDYSYRRSISPSQQYCYVDDYTYSIDGDTIIGKPYIKLKKTGWHHVIYSHNNLTTHDSTFSCTYFGSIRSDSLKKVFFIGKGLSTESLLYDFNLNVGDTLPLSFNYFSYEYNINIVSSIDSILIDGVYRKKYNICTTTYPPYIFASLIEGIGSTRGLFGNLVVPPVSSFLFGCELVCHYLDNNLVLGTLIPETTPTQTNFDIYQCQSTGINEINKAPSIDVYPSPTFDILNIKLIDYKNANEIQIYIVDLSGRKLIESKLNTDFLSLNISQLESGLYILQLVENKKPLYFRKFIKNNYR